MTAAVADSTLRHETDAVRAAGPDPVTRAPSPLPTLHAWLAADIARTQVRLDHIAQIERFERDRLACRAGTFWDEDRRLLAEDLGGSLGRNPTRAVRQLRATPQGCDWLIERWGLLLQISEAGQAWNEGQVSLALDLLGTPTKLREAATVAPRLAEPAGLARAEILALRDQKARVLAADEEDRQQAMADLVDPTTPEFRQIRRHEAVLHRRIKWALGLLDLAGPSPSGPTPGGAERRERSMAPAPKPAPASFTPLRPVGLTTDLAAPVEVVVPKPTPARRPDPAKLRAKARQAARTRRRDR